MLHTLRRRLGALERHTVADTVAIRVVYRQRPGAPPAPDEQMLIMLRRGPDGALHPEQLNEGGTQWR